MRFCFLDEVLEVTGDRCVAIKRVEAGEPALTDHFPTFPILPGVLMLETMAQAARRVLAQDDRGGDRFVISGVRALKYGAMVKPGMELRVTVELQKTNDDGSREFKGTGKAIAPGVAPEDAPTAVSGKFTLRAPVVDAPRAEA